ncbi:MAG: dihydrofolate reductase family protein [Anaerolineales bacterium]
MRKIFLFMMVSLDGYYESPNGDISWHNAVNKEFNEFAGQQTSEADILLFGRKTYELMESYWPTEAAKRDDPIVAGLMNNLPKIVVSKTLNSVKWENTRLIKENVAEEISKLKGQPGKDIAILGSSELTVSLTNMRLVDEYRIMVNPVVLGDGKSLFTGLANNLDLKFITFRAFNSGNVLLYYHPDYKSG